MTWAKVLTTRNGGLRPGRPSRLGTEHMERIDVVLRQPPSEAGLQANLWDGKTLSAFVRQEWGIEMVVRQFQRIFRQLGFRLRKPRPVIAKADPEEQERYKKTPQAHGYE